MTFSIVRLVRLARRHRAWMGAWPLAVRARKAGALGGDDNAAALKFYDSVASWARSGQNRRRDERIVATLAAASHALFRETQPRRQMIAGTQFFACLSAIAEQWHDELRIEDGTPTPIERPIICHLVTEAYAAGGHTRVLEDIVRLLPDYQHVIVATGGSPRAVEEMQAAFRKDVRVTIEAVSGVTHRQRFERGSALLRRLRPHAIMSFAHSFDVVATMLLSQDLALRRAHVHHVDHGFSIVPADGLVPVMTLFPGAADGLRAQGVSNSFPVHATCRDPAPNDMHERSFPTDFTTATCGGSGKFGDRGPHRYIDLVRTRFEARSGRHVHIGGLPKSTLDALRAMAIELGRTEDFIHVPFVLDLAAHLHDLKPALYLGSYPMGGKRASIEAMAAGCPIAAWSGEGFHSAAEIIYPEHLAWRTLTDLKAIIAGLGDTGFHSQARASRSFFEQTYAAARTRDQLMAFLRIDGTAAAPSGQ